MTQYDCLLKLCNCCCIIEDWELYEMELDLAIVAMNTENFGMDEYDIQNHNTLLSLYSHDYPLT